MQRRPLAFILIAVLLGALLWFAWGAGVRGDRVDLAPAQGAAPSPAAVAEEPPEGQEWVVPAAAPPREALDVVEAPADDRPQAASSAWLDVLVLSAEDGEPVEGVRVGCSLHDETGPIDPEPAWVTTDEQGRAQLSAPPGHEVGVWTAPDPAFARASELLPELAPGERREVQLRLRFTSQRIFHGRAVAAESGLPIQGARVVQAPTHSIFLRRVSTDPRSGTQVATTDADGRFHIAERSTDPGTFDILAPDRSQLRFRAIAGHETAERARELRLSRSARLIVSIPDAGGEPLRVQLTTPGYRASAEAPGLHSSFELAWDGRLDPDGTCTIDGLLARAPLSVLVQGAGEVLRRIPDALTLEPEETREVTWSLAGARLRGRVLREDGSPVADVPLWFLAREEPPGIERRILAERDGRKALARTRADGTGHFELEDVAPGRYWIGVAAGSGGAEPLLPLAVPVDIREDSGAEWVELLLPPALYVAGRVLAPDGEPAAGIFVVATSPSIHVYSVTSRGTEKDGRFRVGPMSPGEYQVSTYSMGSGSSEPLNASAGTDDLLIRLQAAGTVSGTIVDAVTRERQPATYTCSSADGGSISTSTSDGTFELSLAPSTYALTATATGPRIGVLSSIVVGAGERVEGLEVRLEPAGQVRVRYIGDTAWSQLRIRWNGATIAADGLRSGTESLRAVPPGEVEVELQIGGEPVESRRVSVAAGEVVEVLFQR